MKIRSKRAASSSYIQVEDFGQEGDQEFLKKFVEPYFKDIFKDLSMRSPTYSPSKQQLLLKKDTFMEYCRLPEVIAKQLHKIFADRAKGMISENSFVDNLIQIFISNNDSRMKMMFKIYDFDNDGIITKEDVRHVLSHIPFEKEPQAHSEDLKQNKFCGKNFQTFLPQQVKSKEVMDEDNSLKQIDLSIQARTKNLKEIDKFVEDAFYPNEKMNIQRFIAYNNNQSSYMYYSIMSILHEMIPCSSNFFRLKRLYRAKLAHSSNSSTKSSSPSSKIASPTMSIGKVKIFESTFKTMSATTNNKQNTDKRSQNNSRNFGQNSQQDSTSSHNCQLMDEKDESLPQLTKASSEQESKHQNLILNIQKLKTAQKRIIFAPHRNLSSSSTIHLNLLNDSSSSPSSELNSPLFKNSVRKNINHQEPEYLKQNLSATQLPKICGIIGIQKQNCQTPKSKFSSKYQSKGNSTQVTPPTQNSKNPPSDFTSYMNLRAEEKLISNFGKKDPNFEKYVYHEGYCQIPSSNYGNLSKFWIAILGNEFFIYSKQHEVQHLAMHCLVGTYVKAMNVEHVNNGILWPLRLILSQKKFKDFYFESQKEQSRWHRAFKEAIGYLNILDYYTIGDTIAKDQTSITKTAIHMLTQQEVTIKCVKKERLTPLQIDQQRREIEVLKMCSHKNIIKLVDLFENSNNFYIVREKLEGNDLLNYMVDRDFKIDEDRVKEIISQLIEALKYLHSFGIVHRDITFESILMSDSSSQAIPKLSHFTISKIISPSEQSNEAFGTIGYIAPEVISKMPYSFSCDLWSIGCICFAMMSGALPFDDTDRKKAIDQALNQALTFDDPCWTSVSFLAKDFIRGLLMKDPILRLSLKDAQQHEWLNTLEL